MALTLIISFLILILVGVPIAISMGIASLITLLVDGGIPLIILAQREFTSLDSFTLLAIPFFILVGTLMEKGGISQRLINFANAFFGHITGGLAIVVVVSSLFFAAIAGSGAAAVAALGTIMIPSMIKKGYKPNFAGGLQAVSAELGVIIPPSITMIIFGVATGTSIGDLFIAGIGPGLFIATTLILVVYIYSKVKGISGDPKKSWSERWIAFKEAFWALLMPVIILGGIYGGIFTPTEASVVAAVYAFIIGTFVYKGIKIKNIIGVFAESAISSTVIMFILANAGLFSWILSRSGALDNIANFFIQISPNVYVFLIITNVVLLFVGMFMEGVAAIIIFAPILTPVAVAFGVDPVHFGLIMIVNLAIGLCTPPVGVNLFISCQIAKISLEKMTRGVLPFIVVLIVDLLIITFIPEISLFLVNLLK